MKDRETDIEPHQAIRIVNSRGSPVVVGRRDRAERIRESIVDLQLVIDGCESQPPERLPDTVASLARHCSIFLRKLVLGDDRSPRLLDDDFCKTEKVDFNRIQKVPSNRRTITLVPIDVTRGFFQATKLDDETLEPEAVHLMPIGQQRLSIAIEWPLSGLADWLRQPTSETPWAIRPEGLFESRSGQEFRLQPVARTATGDVRQPRNHTKGCHSGNSQH